MPLLSTAGTANVVTVQAQGPANSPIVVRFKPTLQSTLTASGQVREVGTGTGGTTWTGTTDASGIFSRKFQMARPDLYRNLWVQAEVNGTEYSNVLNIWVAQLSPVPVL